MVPKIPGSPIPLWGARGELFRGVQNPPGGNGGLETQQGWRRPGPPGGKGGRKRDKSGVEQRGAVYEGWVLVSPRGEVWPRHEARAKPRGEGSTRAPLVGAPRCGTKISEPLHPLPTDSSPAVTRRRPAGLFLIGGIMINDKILLVSQPTGS